MVMTAAAWRCFLRFRRLLHRQPDHERRGPDRPAFSASAPASPWRSRSTSSGFRPWWCPAAGSRAPQAPPQLRELKGGGCGEASASRRPAPRFFFLLLFCSRPPRSSSRRRRVPPARELTSAAIKSSSTHPPPPPPTTTTTTMRPRAPRHPFPRTAAGAGPH